MNKFFSSLAVLFALGSASAEVTTGSDFSSADAPSYLNCSAEAKKNSDVWHQVCAPSLSVIDCDDSVKKFFDAFENYFGLKGYPTPEFLNSDTVQFVYESIKPNPVDEKLNGFQVIVKQDKNSCAGVSIRKF